MNRRLDRPVDEPVEQPDRASTHSPVGPHHLHRHIHPMIWYLGQALVVLLVVAIILPIATYHYFARDLKTPDDIMNRNDHGIILLDKDGQSFYTFFEAHSRTFVPLSDIAPVMKNAVIASEDKDFYHHPGYSLRSMIRAAWDNFRHHEVVAGGSTITQQLVKNALLSPERSYLRKYKELVLARELERRYTKDRILEMYLNSVYFGEGTFGVEAAAQTYFGTDAKDLDAAQASLLVGILPAPTSLSPRSGDQTLIKQHQQHVLEKMVAQRYVSPAEADQAAHETVAIRQDDTLNNLGTHFALMVKQQLIDKYGEEVVSRSGFKVQTTLDSSWQKEAEQIVADQVGTLRSHQVSNGAAVVIDVPTGQVRALVGSKDWRNDVFGKVNIALSNRQPGSSFKPVVYAAALEKHAITLATVLKDEPTSYTVGRQTYTPHDYDGKYRGPVSVRRALANSLNIPAVQVQSKISIADSVNMAKRLGVSTLDDPKRYGLSLVLGAAEVKLLEHTDVYATFANHGTYNPPTLILKITDKHNQVIYTDEPHPKDVLSPAISYLITSILSDTNARKEIFGSALTVHRPAAAKTGTTSDYKDAWTMGYTPHLAIGVWVGNNDAQPMDHIAGALGPAPIWRALIEKFSDGLPADGFAQPDGITRVAICDNGLRADPPSIGHEELFLAGTEPKETCKAPPPPPPSPQPENPAAPSDQPTSQTVTPPEQNSQGQ